MANVINRRAALLGAMAAATAPALPASGQQSFPVANAQLLNLAENQGRVEDLMRKMDLIWIVFALARARRSNEPIPAGAQQTYYGYAMQIARPDQRGPLVAQLRTRDPQASQPQPAVVQTVDRLRGGLLENGLRQGPLIDDLVSAFVVFSELLFVKSPDNDHWWCRCYGLDVLCG